LLLSAGGFDFGRLSPLAGVLVVPFALVGPSLTLPHLHSLLGFVPENRYARCQSAEGVSVPCWWYGLSPIRVNYGLGVGVMVMACATGRRLRESR
jgi:hypothetical protein